MPLFHPALYDWSKPVASYWQDSVGTPPTYPRLEGDHTSEVAIIGGGYCGLSAAYHLAKLGVEATVLEAGPIGWGASGRNGGFCCITSSWLGPKELADIYGEDEMLSFYRTQIDGTRLVDRIASEESIDIERQGDGVWIFAHKQSRVSELADHAAVLNRIGVKTRSLSADQFENEMFACSEQFGAHYEAVGFGLNPLRYCIGLASAAAKNGARIFAHSHVDGWRREGAEHVLTTPTGALRARRVIIAANGWMPEELVPELYGRVVSVISNIITTRPLTEDELARQKWKAQAPASNTRNLLAYLRLLPDKRLLFGGRGDTTGSLAGAAAMRGALTRSMGRLFPAFRDVEITHNWRGFIAATMRLTPAVGELPNDKGVSYAFGCHGNGVAFMTWAGRALAERIATNSDALPAPVRKLPPRFPIPKLRLWGLRAMLVRGWAEDAFF